MTRCGVMAGTYWRDNDAVQASYRPTEPDLRLFAAITWRPYGRSLAGHIITDGMLLSLQPATAWLAWDVTVRHCTMRTPISANDAMPVKQS